jgi:ATP-dependent DNA helicase PIF1
LLPKDIEINPQFERALRLMEKGDQHLFVTGRAGTGKSTLLEYYRSITAKNIVILAPTGVAAVNIGGQTIHSFFGFKPDVTIEKARRLAGKNDSAIYRNLDTIIIDEISMVRSDLLDCVDQFLRISGKVTGLPFGGIQMIFIGDLYQIPPVVIGDEKVLFSDYYESELFFDADVYAEIEVEHLELEKIYRQTDDHFISLLNKIRNKTVLPDDIALLNGQLIDESFTLPKDTIYLTTTNAMAEERNRIELQKLPGRSFFYEAEIKGTLDEKSFPAEGLLEIKEKSQVMLLNNDPAGRWINGTIGRVVRIGEKCLEVQLSDGELVEVKPFRWDMFRFYWDEESRSVAADNVGAFKQYPLKLAWAITIHKSQGKTFDNVVIDLGRGAFASGQLYVALSRCRSFKGIFLKREVKETDVRVDYRVMQYITGRQYDLSEEKLPLDHKIDILREAIEQEAELEIVYLKNTDEKTRRVIKPETVGTMEYSGKKFLGMSAFCLKRNQMRTFRVDRILEIKKGDTVFQVECDQRPGTGRKKAAPKLTGIAACIDVETTGLNSRYDEIVELAMVLFSYDQSGITGIVDSYTGLREPNCDISSGAYGVHGLSLETLAGHQLDTAKIREMIEKADFLVAHNASFDRGFVTKMFPPAKKKKWLCSMSGISWRGSRALQEQLSRHDIAPGQAHRALADVEGLLSLLSLQNDLGITYFTEMIMTMGWESGPCNTTF